MVVPSELAVQVAHQLAVMEVATEWFLLLEALIEAAVVVVEPILTLSPEQTEEVVSLFFAIQLLEQLVWELD